MINQIVYFVHENQIFKDKVVGQEIDKNGVICHFENVKTSKYDEYVFENIGELLEYLIINIRKK